MPVTGLFRPLWGVAVTAWAMEIVSGGIPPFPIGRDRNGGQRKERRGDVLDENKA